MVPLIIAAKWENFKLNFFTDVFWLKRINGQIFYWYQKGREIW